MNGRKNYISIRVIMDNLTAHPLLQDLTLERVVNYTQSFILIVGISASFIEKTEKILIQQYRGLLPCDLYKILQVRINGEAFRASTDSFHMSSDKSNYPDLTYKILGGCIFTSIKEGEVEIAYQGIAVDSDGYPLIPNNSLFIRALESYIKMLCFTVLFDLGKISPQVYLNAQQEYAWNVGLALTSMIMPTYDEMQAISNSWNTLISRVHSHHSGFINEGSKQIIKIQ